MDRTFDPREAARFLRTLRVTTQTAVALDDLRRGRGRARPISTFTALAAKGAGEWRFPAAGLLSADGLVLAHLQHEGGETKVLALQAQGVAGLTTYALRGVRLRLGEALQVEGVFDRDGRLHIVLDDEALSEADLSRLEIELLDSGAMTARVFVPLVGANGEGAQLFEAIAGDAAPEPHPARLLPQISELFDFGLYGIGQTVREAVTRFVASRRAKLWLSRSNGRVNPWNLRISDLQIGRLSDENARSAGLGLALAAICQAFSRDPGIIFATGEILLPSGPGAPAVAIGPIGGLRGKLSLVGDYIVQHRQALEGKRMIVVLPARTTDGRALGAAEATTLDRLREEARGAGARLEFVFADTLDGVEAALGPFAMREIVTPARAVGLAAAFGLFAALTGAWIALTRAPIALAFEPVAALATSRPDDAAPQRARYDSASDKLQLLGPCFDDQRQPVVIGGETLVLRVSARDALPFASRLRAPRLFIASVSRAADPVILDAEHFRSLVGAPRADSPFDLTAAIPIEPVEDEVRLFVVATRDPSIEITGLQDALRKDLQGLAGAAVLTTTTSFLADRLGAEIEYQFKVTNDPHACPS